MFASLSIVCMCRAICTLTASSKAGFSDFHKISLIRRHIASASFTIILSTGAALPLLERVLSLARVRLSMFASFRFGEGMCRYNRTLENVLTAKMPLLSQPHLNSYTPEHHTPLVHTQWRMLRSFFPLLAAGIPLHASLSRYAKHLENFLPGVHLYVNHTTNTKCLSHFLSLSLSLLPPHAHTQTNIHTHSRTQTHKRTNTRTHTFTHTNAHTNTHTQTHTHTHTHGHAHARVRTRTHVPVCLLDCGCVFLS